MASVKPEVGKMLAEMVEVFPNPLSVKALEIAMHLSS